MADARRFDKDLYEKWARDLGTKAVRVVLPSALASRPAFAWGGPTAPPLFPWPEVEAILGEGHGLLLVPGLDEAAKVIGPRHPAAVALRALREISSVSGMWLLLGRGADRPVVLHESRHLKDLKDLVPKLARVVEAALERAAATEAFREQVGRRLLELLCEQRAESDESVARLGKAVPAALARLRTLAEPVDSDLEYFRGVAPAVYRTLVGILSDHAHPGDFPPASFLPAHFP